MSLERKYQKKSERDHILENPDTYTGPNDIITESMYIYDEEYEGILFEEIKYNPALYKLFDEAIVNARDHYVRMLNDPDEQQVTKIFVSFDKETGVISFENDGNGIDVALHSEYNIYIPELIFGHLRTSSNYNKKEEKLTGGKNGFGVKLVAVWSDWFEIETFDHTRGLKYKQRFDDNLSVINPPVIKKSSSTRGYTKISFLPDYERLGISLERMGEHLYSLFYRRAYDISAICGNQLKVMFNKVECKTRHFQDYVNLYIGNTRGNSSRDENALPRVYYADENKRWEYVVCISPSQEFTQVSFVNGIFTKSGGKHVDYILKQITDGLVDYILKKKKIKVLPASIKEQIWIFLRSDIVNPSFTSQTKDYLSTAISQFGSRHEVPDSVIEKIAKLGVLETACALHSAKESKMSAKKTDGVKSRNVKVDGLIDANFAGTANSHRCTLILTEGLSAESGVKGALTEQMRNIYGLYALKGKPLNVRGETTSKITANEEITGIKKILGLVAGTNYTREEVNKKLRYGQVWILTDADLDGHHIKGLILNLFQVEFPSLTNVTDFLGFMVTPIIKAIPRNPSRLVSEILFYSDGEYKRWLDSTEQRQRDKFRIKYYKGLGTSTTPEFKEYMSNNKLVFFNKDKETEDDDDRLSMVFDKKRSEERKQWIKQCNIHSEYLETSGIREVNYCDFINKELVHFSKYDCARSIPSLVDGLKTSQRKILYCAFKKNLVEELRVAQFAGYVSEHSKYHHGEASLYGAIVGMAQSFVGANNVILLSPNGQFGSRFRGGKDSASPRYIYTQLEPITRLIFPKEDDAVLNYLVDDGDKIEPMYYVPIIPMILVNGCNGIGTGFSSFIPCYNTLQIIDAIIAEINGEEIGELMPYYNGYKGTITKKSSSKYELVGVYRVNKNILEITELPVGTWTAKYKEWLDACMDKNTELLGTTIKEFTDCSTENDVKINIQFSEDISNIGNDEIISGMKLSSSVSTANMHLFDHEDVLQKYGSAEDIIKAYVPVRKNTYADRKKAQLEALYKELLVANNKVRYIEANISGEIELKHKTKSQIIDMLQNYQYNLVDESYDYLLTMTMLSVSVERVAKLKQEEEEIKQTIVTLESKTVNDLWMDDLNKLREFLNTQNNKVVKRTIKK